jgi:hypothetical protein
MIVVLPDILIDVVQQTLKKNVKTKRHTRAD